MSSNFFRFKNLDCVVNFDNVSSVKKTDNRIIINFNYLIRKNNIDYVDYLYVDDYVYDDLCFANELWFRKNFIKLGNTWLNKSCISNVKLRDNKIIFNMNVVKPHKFVRDNECDNALTSVFYYENGDKARFEEIINELRG